MLQRFQRLTFLTDEARNTIKKGKAWISQRKILAKVKIKETIKTLAQCFNQARGKKKHKVNNFSSD